MTTATGLRKDLFRHLDAAAQGARVEVVHKGNTLVISAADRGSRLARLVEPVDSEHLSESATGWDAAAKAEWQREQDDLFRP